MRRAHLADGTDGPRVAVIGCGYWGKNLVRNFSVLGALAAVHDSDLATASAMQEEFGAPSRGWEEILEDHSIGAVAISAPAAQHFVLAREALQGSKHVFVEKPLALEVKEAEELCRLADRAGTVLMVGHLMQYHPAFLALKEIVGEGRLGRVEYLYSNRLNLGKFRREESILWSFAPHDISMILSLVGSEPDEVSAVGGIYLHKTIADVTTTHLAFPGGQRAHVFVSWLHPYKEQKLVVVGERGMALFDDGQPWASKLTMYAHRIDWRDGIPQPVRAEAQAVELEPEEPLRMECLHFLDCVRSNRTPRTDGKEGTRVLRVLQAAERSMKQTSSAGSQPESSSDGVLVHESAYIDADVTIGAGTKIWHFSHVLQGSVIGRDCSLGQNVMVGPDVSIGDGCKIQNNVSVYKGVTLEAGVFCGPSCVFTNVINPRSEIERKEEFRSTIVRRGATIGANATIICGNEIGAYSIVAAGAVVTKNVRAHALVAGVPARRIGWVSHDGHRLTDDLTCPVTGRRYQQAGESLKVLDD